MVVSACINGRHIGEEACLLQDSRHQRRQSYPIGDADARMTPTQLYEIETI